MNQSAGPGAESAMPTPTSVQPPEPRPRGSATATKALTGAWAGAATRAVARLGDLRRRNDLGALRDLGGAGAVGDALRQAQPALPLPALLCGLALVYAQGARLHWSVAIALLLASVAAEAGIAALRPQASQLRSDDAARPTAQRTLTSRLGIALLVVAGLCGVVVARVGLAAAALLVVMALVAIAVFAFERVRQRVAPLDELLAAACLGPGLLALMVIAQRQPMTQPDWLVAAALGCVALAAVEGWRLGAIGEPDASDASDTSDASDGSGERADASLARHALVALLGVRVAMALTTLALLAGGALTVLLALSANGWPGALAALLAAPLALLGATGLAISHYAAARREAAQRLADAYTVFGTALACGLALTIVAQGVIAAITGALGG